MYTVDKLSVTAFLSDDPSLPIFQRKSTWKERQRFNLAISLFKKYPIGSVVVKRTDPNDPTSQLYLLDGRQRLETFRAIRDPHQLWRWGKAAGAVRSVQGQPHLLQTSSFVSYITDFLGREDWQEVDATDAGTNESATENSDAVPDSNPTELDEDLTELVSLLTLVHPVTTQSGRDTSRLSEAFALEAFVTGKLIYFEDVEGQQRRFEPARLGIWLEDFAKTLPSPDAYPPADPDLFINWLDATFGVENKGALRTHCAQHWATMAEAMRLLHRLERRLAAAEIGRIAITTSDPDDEKKIFELINNAGSPLTAVEIMSARPEWNELVETSDAKITQAVNGLFSEMDIARSSNAKPRRWDVAATLIDRMNAPVLFDRIRDEATAGSFERRITLGFQLYAGWRLHGISKKHIERIPSAALHWGDDELRGDLEKLSAELAKIAVFQRLSEWGHSIRSLTSEAVALDFSLRLLEAWRRRGNPTNPQAGEWIGFRTEAVHLFDRLVWEYVTREWRGASDSRVAADLESADAGTDKISPARAREWEELTDTITRDARVKGVRYSGGFKSGKWQSRLDRIVVVPLLIYQKIVRNDPGPGSRPAVDHIIPQKLWKALTGADASNETLRALEGNIINLALLPPDVNLAKSSTTLENVLQTDQGMAQKLSQATFISVSDFSEFSKPSQAPALRDFRMEIFKWDLATQRARLVNDPGGYAYIPK